MFMRLLILMTVVPAVELYLLILIGTWIGPAETVLLIVLTGIVGASLAKREGLGLLSQLRTDAMKGIPPANRLVEGIMVLIGGILLMTPGVLTDLTGFTLIAGPTRRWLAPRIKDMVTSRITVMPGVTVGPPRPGPAAEETRRRFDHPIL